MPAPGAPAATGSGTDTRVIIVVGAAGTQSVYHVLRAAGVWMHPDHDTAFNAVPYSSRVVQTPAFGLPGKPIGLINETRASPGDFSLQQLPRALQQQLTAMHQQVAAELLAAVPRGVRTWAWKHPCAIYALPFLLQAFPNAHVIHQVRDGRDVALTNLLPSSRRIGQPYQRHYVQAVMGRTFHRAQLREPAYALAVGHAWARINVGALEWASKQGLGMKGRYSVVRTEDLCSGATARAAVQTMLANAGVAWDEGVLNRAAAVVTRNGACGTDWRVAAWNSSDGGLRAAVRAVDANISGALEAFDYRPATPLRLPGWLDAPAAMQQLRQLGARASLGGQRAVVLTFVSNGYERVVSNWLSWLRSAGLDMARVLVVARAGEARFAAVDPAARAAGAAAFGLPALTGSTAPGRDENGRLVDAWQFERAGVWLERVRCIHELLSAGVPVVLSDLDAIWLRDAAAAVQAAAWDSVTGYDVVSSRGFYPTEVYKRLKLAACMGFVYFNATEPARRFVRAMLRYKLAQLGEPRVRYFNDQRAMNQLLERTPLAFNASASQAAGRVASGAASAPVWGREATTAPQPLRWLFLSEASVQRTCTNNATDASAVVVHCQSPKSGGEKEAWLQALGLWRGGAGTTRRQARRLQHAGAPAPAGAGAPPGQLAPWLAGAPALGPGCIELHSGPFGLGCTLNFLLWAVTLLREAHPALELRLDHGGSSYQCLANASLGELLQPDAGLLRLGHAPPGSGCVRWDWFAAVRHVQAQFHRAWRRAPAPGEPTAPQRRTVRSRRDGRAASAGGLSPAHVEPQLLAAALAARCETVTRFWRLAPQVAAQAQAARAALGWPPPGSGSGGSGQAPTVAIHARGGDKRAEFHAARDDSGHYPLLPGLRRLAVTLAAGPRPACLVLGDDAGYAAAVAALARGALNCSSVGVRTQPALAPRGVGARPSRGHMQRRFNAQPLATRCGHAQRVLVDMQLMASADWVVASPLSNLAAVVAALRGCLHGRDEASMVDGRGHARFGVWV